MPYNPNEPRKPGGTSEGGEWTSEQLNTIQNIARKAAGLSDKTGALSYEKWSMEHFNKVYPRTGIFADQYDSYLMNYIPPVNNPKATYILPKTRVELTEQQAVDMVANYSGSEDLAFRGDNFIPINKFRNSQYHGDDEGMQNTLPGVSAIAIPANTATYIKDAIAKARKYGRNVFLLAGQSTNNMEGDPNEVLMIKHRIIGIIK